MIRLCSYAGKESTTVKIIDGIIIVAEIDFIKIRDENKYIVLQCITMHQIGVIFDDIDIIAKYISNDIYPISQGKQDELTKKLIDFENELRETA